MLEEGNELLQVAFRPPCVHGVYVHTHTNIHTHMHTYTHKITWAEGMARELRTLIGLAEDTGSAPSSDLHVCQHECGPHTCAGRTLIHMK